MSHNCHAEEVIAKCTECTRLANLQHDMHPGGFCYCVWLLGWHSLDVSFGRTHSGIGEVLPKVSKEEPQLLNVERRAHRLHWASPLSVAVEVEVRIQQVEDQSEFCASTDVKLG